MAADKELLKEVALELWNTTKKLRPGLPKAPRAQLVLKALLTIGDMSDQLEGCTLVALENCPRPKYYFLCMCFQYYKMQNACPQLVL